MNVIAFVGIFCTLICAFLPQTHPSLCLHAEWQTQEERKEQIFAFSRLILCNVKYVAAVGSKYCYQYTFNPELFA